MEALRLDEYITEDGIYISNEKLKKFRNMRVEIIILPLEENKEEKKFMKFAGILKENESLKILEDIEDCRKIDEENW
ncbi:MAG: hypothetical protein A2086_09625 [Spirochaetes bacterium GWD1_27_9]|nr:MAG: hypothetical protein A2Z98_14155 [Spirochaetes bacterium GWB1_27_13]OHD25982.1 MAG: hypothetical protein A2Y34_07055 [Spirochaetes bacterium GWC1_27_15]OHD31660.1 MAG: hypothetical protein A2086_09625 [Spirochaetes bacterium GWD1_27_9]